MSLWAIDRFAVSDSGPGVQTDCTESDCSWSGNLTTYPDLRPITSSTLDHIGSDQWKAVAMTFYQQELQRLVK